LWRKWLVYLASPGAVRPRGLVLCGLVVAFSIPDLTMGVWVFLFACLCQIAALPNGVESRVVQTVGSSGPALFIGRISYSIYLAHWPVSIVLIHCAAKYLYGRVPTYALWGIFAVVAGLVTIGVATLLYYFVEAPAIRWGKKLFKEDKGPAPMDARV
ncbi:MAG TPA: hypothetical protein VG733_18525, partial [Chthoniobacteraceae bacterium]|nr:hypothetical protein [Chthoniobacteraceae bacterium]